MKILIGTTNPSKVKRFSPLLSDCNVEFLTLKDIGVTDEPEEKGKTPEENAVIKAKYYGGFFDTVICNDSGLYFDCMLLDDVRQPGLNIRTPQGCERLDEEEMITYYSELASSLGGKVLAFYLDGIAVYNHGKIYSFMENGEAVRASAFYLVDTPSDKRHPGWPLDSISVNKNTLAYFVDDTEHTATTEKENIIIGEYRKKLVEFLKNALGI